MRSAALEPLDEYPGAGKPWRSRCERCGDQVWPRLSVINKGGGGCRRCAGVAPHDPDEAAAVMRAAGLEPLVPYPGSSKPWRCRCTACGTEVTPTFSHVNKGRRGCMYCGNRARTRAHDAEAEIRAAGFEPTGPYPGRFDAPWPCRCLRCGNPATPRLGKIRAGEGGCKICGDAASAGKRRFADEEAAEAMLAAGLTPLEPYPGNHTAWRCRCNRCGAEVGPRRANVSVGQGGCFQCGQTQSGVSQRLDEQQAIIEMVTAGFIPQEPYRGVDHSWVSLCLRCNQSVSPRLSYVRSSSGGGCEGCGRTAQVAARRLDAGLAVGEMRAAFFEPLEPYPGTNYKWRCRCTRCGNEVTPKLQKIRAGEGGCGNCTEWGFKPAEPGWLYVLYHAGFEAVKVGISGADSRIKGFQSRGWNLVERLDFAAGAQAFMLERSVKELIKTRLGLKPFLTAKDMGRAGGWTETFDAQCLSSKQLVAIVRSEQSRLNLLEVRDVTTAPVLAPVGQLALFEVHTATPRPRTGSRTTSTASNM